MEEALVVGIGAVDGALVLADTLVRIVDLLVEIVDDAKK